MGTHVFGSSTAANSKLVCSCFWEVFGKIYNSTLIDWFLAHVLTLFSSLFLLHPCILNLLFAWTFISARIYITFSFESFLLIDLTVRYSWKLVEDLIQSDVFCLSFICPVLYSKFFVNSKHFNRCIFNNVMFNIKIVQKTYGLYIYRFWGYYLFCS